MRVLLFCPTYRLEKETVDAIMKIKPIGPMEILFTRDNPYGDGYTDVLHNYRKGRAAVLDGGYDALFVVESDMIPPADALIKLAAMNTDIASGLYMYRHGRPMVNALRKEGSKNPGQSMTLFPNEALRAKRKGVVETGGAGIGCVLIKRRVLEDIDFRNDHGAYCDWFFTADSMRAGFKWMINFDVVCGHKRPDGIVIWPEDGGVDFTFEEGDSIRDYYCEEAL